VGADFFANFQVGFGAWEGDALLPKNESLGRYPGTAGWGMHTFDISSFLGQTVNIRFALESDLSMTFAGMVVDDVQVLGCLSNNVYVPLASK